jgi:hypothetical protein
MHYNDHQVEVSVQRVSGGWMPDIFMTYCENGKNVLESLRMNQTFATAGEAEQAGVKYAKKWIDDGKPDQ